MRPGPHHTNSSRGSSSLESDYIGGRRFHVITKQDSPITAVRDEEASPGHGGAAELPERSPSPEERLYRAKGTNRTACHPGSSGRYNDGGMGHLPAPPRPPSLWARSGGPARGSRSGRRPRLGARPGAESRRGCCGPGACFRQAAQRVGIAELRTGPGGGRRPSWGAGRAAGAGVDGVPGAGVCVDSGSPGAACLGVRVGSTPSGSRHHPALSQAPGAGASAGAKTL